MVGGGEGAFIGAIHRMAARLDGRHHLLAGALSSDPEKARKSGERLGLHPDRIYPDYQTMARLEALRGDGIEAVAIVTPNDLHAPIAKAFLEAGVHVICDKPFTTSLEDALHLVTLREKQGLLLAVNYNYSFYPLVRTAREMVQSGKLGQVRVVQVEYPQDWLTRAIEADGQKQAAWRTDPSRAGAGALGDIGSHAFQLAEFVTGMRIRELFADLDTFVAGRRVDDNAHILLRFVGGAKGMLWASQVAPGNDNGLRIRVYGADGGLEWRQEDCNALYWAPFGEPMRRIVRGGPQPNSTSDSLSRLPPGHPEGYIEAFANVYNEVAQCIRHPECRHLLDWNLSDGFRGVRFIAAAQESARRRSWCLLDDASG
jgi:predicted dehydrogenase